MNVHQTESRLLTEFLPDVAKLAAIFRSYGIKLFLSINYASTMEIGGLETADPLDPNVRDWWRMAASAVYEAVPDFGDFWSKPIRRTGRDHSATAEIMQTEPICWLKR